MNILLVTDSYPPEIRSASHLMLELAEELNHRGHQVTVITTWPEYNLDQEQTQKTFNELEVESNITVIRVRTLPHHNVNYIVRALAQLLMPVQFLLKLRRHRISPDACVVYSPPLPLALVGSWLARKGVRNLLNVQDLFPQNAIDLGILSNPLQIRFFRALERYAYRTADVVTVHSEGNRRMLVAQNPEVAPHLRILHNWVDIDHHSVDEPNGEAPSHQRVAVDFRQRWAIQRKFVAVFAGVMGPSQYLDLILAIAGRMRERKDFLFLLVGDGKEKERLQKLAHEQGLDNVQFEGFVSRDVYRPGVPQPPEPDSRGTRKNTGTHGCGASSGGLPAHGQRRPCPDPGCAMWRIGELRRSGRLCRGAAGIDRQGRCVCRNRSIGQALCD